MSARSFNTQGIILGKKNYSESDKIVGLYTKDYGKLFVLAKAARLPKSRKRGSLETFNLIHFQAIKTKSMDIITEVQIIDSYEHIKKDLKKISVAYFLLEVVNRLTREDERNENIFELLKQALNTLETSNNTRRVREQFICDVLIELGFWPEEKPMDQPDAVLESVAEKKFSSARIGKRILS